ncbi:MAG: hypothetical protein AB1432_01555 [Bacteroidota bacterium]
MKLQLNNDEKKDLELIQEKRKNLFLQDQFLTARWNTIIEEFCKRNSQDVSKAKNVNLETGVVEFEEQQQKKKK